MKRPRMTANLGDTFLKKINLKWQVRELADKKTTYNEVHLYFEL
jgi:hypothetical protein